MRIALIQMRSLIGAPERNAKYISDLLIKNSQHADVFVCPELALIGYPCRDLMSYPEILEAEAAALETLKQITKKLKVALLIGHSSPSQETAAAPLHNSASFIFEGKVLSTVHKRRIPHYNIFSEERFFAPSKAASHTISHLGQKLAFSICEDSWDCVLGFGYQDMRSYPAESNPMSEHQDADIEINLSASPYSRNKKELRLDLFRALAVKHQKSIFYCNSVGGQDDILFDGASFVVDSQGAPRALAKSFSEDLLIFDTKELQKTSTEANSLVEKDSNEFLGDPYEELSQALVMGMRSFAQDNSFRSALIGLSGGIDSALSAYLAAKALGADNVKALYLPTQHNSPLSEHIVDTLASRLGIRLEKISIQDSVTATAHTLGLDLKGLTFENIQSRMRGLFLMALANKEGHMLLSTGNKSEMALGYCTLYGDMCGALNPIGDLYKSDVFALSHHACIKNLREGLVPPFPPELLTRAPTAELAENQKDRDAMPDYAELDTVLFDLLENSFVLRKPDSASILKAPFDLQWLKMAILKSEFKRRQAPPILRVNLRAFGSGWQMPISKGFKG